MEWYNIIVLIVGALGGTAGIISVYHAKSNKDTIDISNLTAIIDEERKERLSLRQEYDEYKDSVDERIRMFKVEFDKMKKSNLAYIKAIYQAYRCKYPQNACDCPVIKAIEASGVCNSCENENNH